MTDRDRQINVLAELLENLDDLPFYTYKDEAEYLIDEYGVIVPPCKVGDIVYYPYEYGNKVLEKTVIKIVIEKEDRWLDVGVSFLPFENIGKTVFLTKEEAEKKLHKLETDTNVGSKKEREG